MHRSLSLLGSLLVAVPLAAHADDLALRRVMLSTGGVGYFEFGATVDGPASLGLDVPLAQVDDVLASLVVFDSGGSVGGIDLPGRDGQRAAFANLPFGPSALHSALEYLNSLQGVAITVAGPRPMSGRLLRAESVSEPGAAPGAVAHHTRVSLLTDAGLQQFVLEEADSVQVADPALRAAIARALDAVRAEPPEAARHLKLHGDGTGHREVRVGYVAGAPLWKTTYRLVLPTADGTTARLQGWAVLENESGADWNNVDLTLQYGNPVTFRQALYRSYYVQRPEVPLDVLNRILPGIDPGDHPAAAAAPPPAGTAPMPVVVPAPRAMAMAKSMPAAGIAAQNLAAPEETAAPTEAAESTQFHIPSPISLAAGHSASLPLLDRAVPAERIGVVQFGHAHPLQTVQLHNDTGASLPAGVLTLYDPSEAIAFAGESRLGGMPAGETRLLEFAEDLRTSVDWRTDESTNVSGITAAQGMLSVQQRQRWTARITLTAPPDEARRLLLEIPRRGADSTLTVDGDSKAGSETNGVWRVPVTIKAGKTRTVVAYVDRVLHEQTSVLDDDTVLAQVIDTQSLGETARAALRHIGELRAAMARAEQTRDKVKAQQESVAADEDRVRKILAAVAPSDALHGKLLHQLDTDEQQISGLNAALADAEAAVAAARSTLEQAVKSLKL